MIVLSKIIPPRVIASTRAKRFIFPVPSFSLLLGHKHPFTVYSRLNSMASSNIVSADKISLEEFNRRLVEYESLIQRVSDEKGGMLITNRHHNRWQTLTASLWIAKGGQKTLLELDEYRYRKALENFNTESRAQPMALDDIKTLVEWKL